MLINEVSKVTNLTKKAIEYYVKQNLVFPDILPNGYRDFKERDVERLKKISIYRRLEISIEEIKLLLDGKTNYTEISIKRGLRIEKENRKKAILDRLILGANYEELTQELTDLEKGLTVTEKLLVAFPGYYGQFICLHFERFLNEPITTEAQQSAYEEIVEFLDHVPILEFDEDLHSFMLESTKNITYENIHEILDSTKQSIENVDEFFMENKDVIEQYLEYKQSEEYKDSLAYKLEMKLKEFNKTSGYYDVFIPAMKRLSRSYSDYFRKLEKANSTFLKQYPESNSMDGKE